MSAPAIQAYLVAAGDFHDVDFARLELLKLLAEHENIRTTVASDYSDIEGIQASDFLVSYTINLIPSEAEQAALKAYVESGKKWFALHGTNSIVEFTDAGVACPETAPIFMETLGSQFMAHPPIQPFTVKPTSPDHPLVKGISSFETTDELYLSKPLGELEVLMHTTLPEKPQALFMQTGPMMNQDRSTTSIGKELVKCCISIWAMLVVTTICNPEFPITQKSRGDHGKTPNTMNCFGEA